MTTTVKKSVKKSTSERSRPNPPLPASFRCAKCGEWKMRTQTGSILCPTPSCGRVVASQYTSRRFNSLVNLEKLHCYLDAADAPTAEKVFGAWLIHGQPHAKASPGVHPISEKPLPSRIKQLPIPIIPGHIVAFIGNHHGKKAFFFKRIDPSDSQASTPPAGTAHTAAKNS